MKLPANPAKSDAGEFARFKNFMTRLVAVPHSEIKAKLDAEKAAKLRKPKHASASRASTRTGLVNRFSHLASQFRVSEPLANNLRHCQKETVRVVEGIIISRPIIVAKYLLIDVAPQVIRLHGNVGSIQAAFQQAPEVLKAVSVNLPTDVSSHVVHDFVRVTCSIRSRHRLALDRCRPWSRAQPAPEPQIAGYRAGRSESRNALTLRCSRSRIPLNGSLSGRMSPRTCKLRA